MIKISSTSPVHTLITAVLLVTLAGCSFKTLYNKLEYIIPAYVEGLVTLDDALGEKLNARTQALLAWHRTTQLTGYADWLRGLQADFGPQLDEADLEQHISRFESFWLALSSRLNDEMADLLPLLNSEQQHELFVNVADKNAAFREDYIDIENDERVDNYYDNLVDSYENWLGDLNSQQHSRIQATASKLRSSASQRLQRRVEWQNGIENILASNIEPVHKTTQLREFFTRFDSEDPELAAITQFNRTLMTELTLQLVHSADAEQRAHFMEKTGDYIRMLEELAEKQ